METSIQISKELLNKLKLMKMHAKESYEDLIWDLVEDRMEFSDEVKKSLREHEKEIKKNGLKNFIPFEQVKKDLGL